MPPAPFGIYTLTAYVVGSAWPRIAAAFHGPTYALAATIVLVVPAS